MGRVYLVGAGPGDPDLMTVKAARLLAEADVVVHDRLVGSGVLDLIPAGVRRVFVGKAGDDHAVPQSEISRMLVDLAREYPRVVRLKGGDPFIFGRGSEEAQELAQAGVPFEVVPGVTAAAGVGAAIGVPLTHRGLATGVRFATAHRRDQGEIELDWSRMNDPDTTLVFYMGLNNLGEVVKNLTLAGLDPLTPAAAISRGTAPDQVQVHTTLGALPGEVAAAGLSSPVLFMVGRVVEMAAVLGNEADRSKDQCFGVSRHA